MKRELIGKDDIVYTYMNTETGSIDYVLREGDTIKVDTKEQKEYRANHKEIKKNNTFVKVFKDTIEILAREKNLTKNDYKVILIAMSYLEKTSGVLTEDGVNISKARFLELSELSHNTFTDSINRLINLQIMAKTRVGRNNVYLLNPFIFLNGTYINATLYRIFKKSKWNTNND